MSSNYRQGDDDIGKDRPWESLGYPQEVYERLRRERESLAEGLREIRPLNPALAEKLSHNENLHHDIAGALRSDVNIGAYMAEKWQREGIKRNEFDMPIFSPYSIATVNIAEYYDDGFYNGNHYYPSRNVNWTGISKSDYVNATREAALPYDIDCDDIMELARGEDWVWHHHEDTQTMQLVPVEIHDIVPHRGGASFVEARRYGNRH